MRKNFILMLSSLLLIIVANAQNVGIGIATPTNMLQVAGNLLVNQPLLTSVNPPTQAQQLTMANGTSITFQDTDSTGRLYDPSGPTGDYIANLNSTAVIPYGNTNEVGIQIQIESINLGTLDSLIITDGGSRILLAVGNNYNTSGSYFFNELPLQITFKSNSDASVGTGFSLLYKVLYFAATIPSVKNFVGNSMFFDTKRGAFRAGNFYDDPIGNYSVAMGVGSIASGTFSTAMGYGTTASGDQSTAMGNLTLASGINSTAMGSNATASGDHSTALGAYVSTGGQAGSFIIGDYDPNGTGTTTVTTPNQFVSRFYNGYYLMTGDNNTLTGMFMNNGDNSWSLTLV